MSLILRFKKNLSEELVAEYYINDNITQEQINELDNKIDELYNEYAKAHNDDFIECDNIEIIEKALQSVNIEFKDIVADYNIIL